MFQLNQNVRAIGLKAKIPIFELERSKSSEFRNHVRHPHPQGAL